MALPLNKIAFILEDLALQTPAQQILDRFLMGYARNGEFHKLKDCTIAVFCIRSDDGLTRRKKDFGLEIAGSIQSATERADAVVIASGGAAVNPPARLVQQCLASAKNDARCFVYGPLEDSRDAAEGSFADAKRRGITLCSARSVTTTFRLPAIPTPNRGDVRDALIVVHQETREAVADALEGLLPFLENRHGGVQKIHEVKTFKGAEVWSAGSAGAWSLPLMGAALSRSNTTQGDSLTDGRTQDIAGLGLAQKLARHPQAWVVHFEDGFHATVLNLEGAVKDINVALQFADEKTWSTQLYRPAAPAREEYSLLCAQIEDFFRGGISPFPVARSLLVAELFSRMVTA
jgi:hypothetical protein